MKLLATLTGGYRRVMDRLLTLQSETVTFIDAQLNSLGYDMVLSGCPVTNNNNGTVNIGPGIVYIGGASMRFAGANNIAADGSQAFAPAAPVTSYPQTFGDNSTKNIYSEVMAVIVAQTPANTTQLKVKTTLYNLQAYIQDQVYQAEPKGAIKELYDLDGTFLSTNFDGTGLGITPRWVNWAVDNKNNGTPGSVGMALIAAGTYVDTNGQQTIYTEGVPVGERLHKLTADEAAIPAGLPPGLDGPHAKPGDGGGQQVYYVNGPLQNGSPAVNGHNNMQPSMPVIRLVKIR
jgi:hypothetical protein